MKITGRHIIALMIASLLLGYKGIPGKEKVEASKPPNILLVISDDQSYPYASAYGNKATLTPAFDRVAREGVLFLNAMTASPGCSPSRAALLTGRNCWQIEEAATHASGFSTRYKVYPDILEEAGYFVGFTGKGWGPGNWKISGRNRNPAGTEYNEITLKDNPKGIANTDYAANFGAFLSKKVKNKPFCFWFGGREPHRVFDKGIGVKKIDAVTVPGFLPDNAIVRSDISDYCYEIEWFDKQLGKAIALLEQAGELDNTLIVVTSDNGMAFPRAKANTYEYGIHVPLAIKWGNKFTGNRIVRTPVSLTDLAPTFLEAAGIDQAIKEPERSMAGTSLMNILLGKKDKAIESRLGVYSSRERHSSSRWNNLGYPQRALRTNQYLFIWNLEPGRWPAGDPRKFEQNVQTYKLELGPEHGAYHDIDAAPTLDMLVEGRESKAIAPFFHLAVDKRPEEELYDILKDPACLSNLANAPQFEKIKSSLKSTLMKYMKETNDPRITGKGAVIESYPRYEGEIRSFPPPK
ncbi:MAG: sulfatase [Chitinophagaceae bacterium]